MDGLLRTATVELARFLSDHLSNLRKDWWRKHVENRLIFRQQHFVQEQGITTSEQLDLAALLRVLEQNWYELPHDLNLPRQGFTWIKELQNVRNRWAHLPAQLIVASDVYRDTDTLGRLLKVLGADANSLMAVEASSSCRDGCCDGGVSRFDGAI